MVPLLRQTVPMAHRDSHDSEHGGHGEHDPEASAAAGVEHLQAAAHEVLAAARSFLNAVEDVVSDRDKLSAAAATVTDLLGTAGASISNLADRVTGQPPSGSGDPAAATPRPRVRRIDVD